MIDSLALTLALLATPVQRPNMDRVSHFVAPVETTTTVSIKPDDVWGGQMLTTCYENKSGSCWSED